MRLNRFKKEPQCYPIITKYTGLLATYSVLLFGALSLSPLCNLVNWQVYIILCTDDSLYTGITNDVVRRFNQHAGKQGAKYFRGRQPKHLVYVEINHDRSSAGKRECAIKKLSRVQKLQLLAADSNQVSTFVGATPTSRLLNQTLTVAT